METIEQKKRRLIGKIKYLDTYIKTLNRITFKKVDPTMLLSVVDTDRLCPMADFNIDYKTTLYFCNKKDMWDKIRYVFGCNPLYIRLQHFRECGLFPLESINLFNIDFQFEDDPGEMIVLVSKNCSQEVVLDFYDEYDIRKIDIEIRSATKTGVNELENRKESYGTSKKKLELQRAKDCLLDKPYWEAGSVKIDERTGKMRMNCYGRPKLYSSKSKTEYMV